MGEISAELYGRKQDTVEFAAMVSGIAAAVAGRDVGVASAAGANAAANNFLNHDNVAQLAAAFKKYPPGSPERTQAIDEAYAQSAVNDMRLLTCKASGTCDAVKAEYVQGYKDIAALVDAGLPSADVESMFRLENTAQLILNNKLQNRQCFTADCKATADLLLGVSKGLAKVTPAGIVAGTGVAAYELTSSIVNNGAGDAAVAIVKGIAGLPQSLLDGLNSTNPQVRGEALVDALSMATVATAVSAKLAQTGIGVASKVAASEFDRAATDALLKSGGSIDALTGRALLDMSQLTNAQKGVAGDLFGANLVKQIVPDGQKLGRAPVVGETGIDDLYKVSRPDVDYVKIEYKFVGNYNKLGSSSLGNTLDGKQGSDGWFLGSDRLAKSVGDEAGKVENAIKVGRTETWLVTTRPDGSTELHVLDAFGKPKPIDTSKTILLMMNLSGAKP